MLNFVDILIKSNTINFLIVLGIIVFISLKLNIGKRIQNIAEEIKNYVETPYFTQKITKIHKLNIPMTEKATKDIKCNNFSTKYRQLVSSYFYWLLIIFIFEEKKWNLFINQYY